MMSDGESQAKATPDRFERGVFILSLATLILGLSFWTLLYVRPYIAVFQQLGMTELPWLTQTALAIGEGAAFVLPILTLVLLLFGIMALKRATAKTLNRLTAINFIIAVLIPCYVYVAVQMPLIELQKKLGGS